MRFYLYRLKADFVHKKSTPPSLDAYVVLFLKRRDSDVRFAPESRHARTSQIGNHAWRRLTTVLAGARLAQNSAQASISRRRFSSMSPR
jgi:hypothetical protein